MHCTGFIKGFTEGSLSLSFLKNQKSCVDIDMAGEVSNSSSFPSHPLFPILPAIISNSHEPLKVIRKIVLKLSKLQSPFA